MTPRWMTYARTFNGLKEVPGPQTNPTIGAWLKKLGAWWKDDQTPWCGTFVAHCLQASSVPIPKNWFRALDWAAWGKPCEPCVGAIAVKARKGGGHVFFVAGRTADGRIVGYGGNQGDKVCDAIFNPADIVAYRWPSAEPPGDRLSQLAAAGAAGVSEA